jgi:hypothetical protein
MRVRRASAPFLVARAHVARFIAPRVSLCAVLLCCLAPLPCRAAPDAQADLSRLPITFPVQSPEVAAYFAQVAGAQDIASLSPEGLSLLPEGHAGQVMVGFRSWADAERELDAVRDRVDWVMYNPENWALTPAEEKEQLATVVQRAAEFTHQRGLRFMFAPDRRFAEQVLTEVAPYIDAVLLQGQRLQADPQVFASWVLEMAGEARAVHADLSIYVQVAATRGPAAEMYAALQTVSEEIDGIAIWSMPRSLDVLRDLVVMLRQSPPAPAAVSSPVLPSPTPAPTLPSTPTRTPSPTVTATPLDDVPTRTPLPTATAPAQKGTATSTPVPVAVLPTQTRAATSTPPGGQGHPAIETPSLTAAATPLSLAARQARMRETLKDIGLIVASLSIGLLLGFGLGRRKHGSNDRRSEGERPEDERPEDERPID